MKLNFFLWSIYCRNLRFVTFIIDRVKNHDHDVSVPVKVKDQLPYSSQGLSPHKEINTESVSISERKYVDNTDIQQLVDLVSLTDKNGNTPLHIAAYVNDLKIVEALNILDEKQQLIPNKRNQLPFQLAIEHNNYDLVPILIPSTYLDENHPSIKLKLQTGYRVSHLNEDEKLQDQDSIDNLKSLGNESHNLPNKNYQETHNHQQKRMEAADQIGQSYSELDALVVESLNKSGLYNQKEITEKYKNFKQTMMSFRQNKENLNNTLDLDNGVVINDDSYYMVKKGKVSPNKIKDNNSSIVGKSSYAVSEIECEQTVAAILRNKGYLEQQNLALRLKDNV